jgi:CheY-like chemotaxis protein
VLTVQQILQRLLGEDVELITRLATPLGVVRADVGQIEQVLLNLAVNGRDAMPGGGRLTIETANVELPAAPASGEPVISAGRYVTLVVGDTGEGIDPEARAHIFEPFFTTKAPGEGTGLGLATVYGIVKQSGGHIEVDSEPGRGTTFTIYLPRVDEVAEPTAPPPEAGPSEHGTETILVVEDERAVRELAARGLREHGYTVLTAERAEEAIRLLDEERPPVDLLLTDAVLPGASGLTLASVATARRPGLQVVYMSGYAHEALARQGMLEPGMILIEKPFTPATLARKVREVLDRR